MTCGKSVVSSFNKAERGPCFNGNIVESGVKHHTHPRFSDSDFPFGMFKLFLNCNFLRFPILKRFHWLVCIEWRYRYIYNLTPAKVQDREISDNRGCRRCPCRAHFAGVWFYFSLFSAIFSFVFVWQLCTFSKTIM